MPSSFSLMSSTPINSWTMLFEINVVKKDIINKGITHLEFLLPKNEHTEFVSFFNGNFSLLFIDFKNSFNELIIAMIQKSKASDE